MFDVSIELTQLVYAFSQCDENSDLSLELLQRSRELTGKNSEANKQQLSNYLGDLIHQQFSNVYLDAIREIIRNALDAQVRSGTSTPIDIQLGHDSLVVTNEGDEFNPFKYFVPGRSANTNTLFQTKQSTDNQTAGKFGQGAFASLIFCVEDQQLPPIVNHPINWRQTIDGHVLRIAQESKTLRSKKRIDVVADQKNQQAWEHAAETGLSGYKNFTVSVKKRNANEKKSHPQGSISISFFYKGRSWNLLIENNARKYIVSFKKLEKKTRKTIISIRSPLITNHLMEINSSIKKTFYINRQVPIKLNNKIINQLSTYQALNLSDATIYWSGKLVKGSVLDVFEKGTFVKDLHQKKRGYKVTAIDFKQINLKTDRRTFDMTSERFKKVVSTLIEEIINSKQCSFEDKQWLLSSLTSLIKQSDMTGHVKNRLKNINEVILVPLTGSFYQAFQGIPNAFFNSLDLCNIPVARVLPQDDKTKVIIHELPSSQTDIPMAACKLISDGWETIHVLINQRMLHLESKPLQQLTNKMLTAWIQTKYRNIKLDSYEPYVSSRLDVPEKNRSNMNPHREKDDEFVGEDAVRHICNSAPQINKKYQNGFVRDYKRVVDSKKVYIKAQYVAELERAVRSNPKGAGVYYNYGLNSIYQDLINWGGKRTFDPMAFIDIFQVCASEKMNDSFLLYICIADTSKAQTQYLKPIFEKLHQLNVYLKSDDLYEFPEYFAYQDEDAFESFRIEFESVNRLLSHLLTIVEKHSGDQYLFSQIEDMMMTDYGGIILYNAIKNIRWLEVMIRVYPWDEDPMHTIPIDTVTLELLVDFWFTNTEYTSHQKIKILRQFLMLCAMRHRLGVDGFKSYGDMEPNKHKYKKTLFLTLPTLMKSVVKLINDTQQNPLSEEQCWTLMVDNSRILIDAFTLSFCRELITMKVTSSDDYLEEVDSSNLRSEWNRIIEEKKNSNDMSEHFSTFQRILTMSDEIWKNNGKTKVKYMKLISDAMSEYGFMDETLFSIIFPVFTELFSPNQSDYKMIECDGMKQLSRLIQEDYGSKDMAERRLYKAINQASDPYDFINELIKNIIEAKSKLADIHLFLDSEHRVCLKIKDNGQGIHDLTILTRPGASTKPRNGDLRNYGQGFLGVFAIVEDVAVSSGKDILIMSNRNNVLYTAVVQSREPVVAGTEMVLRLPTNINPVTVSIMIENQLRLRWGRSQELNIIYSDKQINNPKYQRFFSMQFNRNKFVIDVEIVSGTGGLYLHEQRLGPIPQNYLKIIPKDIYKYLENKGYSILLRADNLPQTMDRNKLIEDKIDHNLMKLGILVSVSKFIAQELPNNLTTMFISDDYWNTWCRNGIKASSRNDVVLLIKCIYNDDFEPLFTQHQDIYNVARTIIENMSWLRVEFQNQLLNQTNEAMLCHHKQNTVLIDSISSTLSNVDELSFTLLHQAFGPKNLTLYHLRDMVLNYLQRHKFINVQGDWSKSSMNPTDKYIMILKKHFEFNFSALIDIKEYKPILLRFFNTMTHKWHVAYKQLHSDKFESRYHRIASLFVKNIVSIISSNQSINVIAVTKTNGARMSAYVENLLIEVNMNCLKNFIRCFKTIDDKSVNQTKNYRSIGKTVAVSLHEIAHLSLGKDCNGHHGHDFQKQFRHHLTEFFQFMFEHGLDWPVKMLTELIKKPDTASEAEIKKSKVMSPLSFS